MGLTKNKYIKYYLALLIFILVLLYYSIRIINYIKPPNSLHNFAIKVNDSTSEIKKLEPYNQFSYSFYWLSSWTGFRNEEFHFFGSKNRFKSIQNPTSTISLNPNIPYEVIAYLNNDSAINFVNSFETAVSYISDLALGMSFTLTSFNQVPQDLENIELEDIMEWAEDQIPTNSSNQVILIQINHVNEGSIEGVYREVSIANNNHIILSSQFSNSPALIAHELNHIQNKNDYPVNSNNNLMGSGLAIDVYPCYTGKQYLDLTASIFSPNNWDFTICTRPITYNYDIPNELDYSSTMIDYSNQSNKSFKTAQLYRSARIDQKKNHKELPTKVAKELSYRYGQQYDQYKSLHKLTKDQYIALNLENVRRLRQENILNELAYQSTQNPRIADSLGLDEKEKLVFDKYRKYYKKG